MENIQPYQQRLELPATPLWHPRFAHASRMHVVSTGRAGVDRAALDVARALGLSVGEPRGRPVHDSDATLILTLGTIDTASTVIENIARRTGKPFLVVQLDAPDALEKARAWMDEVRPQSLNVAGVRASRQPGVYGRAYAFLSRVLRSGTATARH